MTTKTPKKRGPGQPPKAPEDRRESRKFRASAREWAVIRRRAKAAGLPVTTYIRQAALGQV